MHFYILRALRTHIHNYFSLLLALRGRGIEEVLLPFTAQNNKIRHKAGAREHPVHIALEVESHGRTQRVYLHINFRSWACICSVFVYVCIVRIAACISPDATGGVEFICIIFSIEACGGSLTHAGQLFLMISRKSTDFSCEIHLDKILLDVRTRKRLRKITICGMVMAGDGVMI